MHLQWLVFPAVLTVVTIALFLWTFVSDWQHRLINSVWKDSILSVLFYLNRFELDDGRNLQEIIHDITGTERRERRTDSEEQLMEVDGMVETARKLNVSFRWHRDVGFVNGTSASTTSLQPARQSLGRRPISSPDINPVQPGERQVLIDSEGIEDHDTAQSQ
jgi:hypothetical protein